MNTYTKDLAKKNQFTRIDSFLVEWDLNINRIKRVYMTAVPEGDGAMGSDVIFHFGENYYQKYDIFIVEKTRQQFMVMNRPQRISDKDFVVIAKIWDSNYESVVDTSGAFVGSATRFITLAVPEMHDLFVPLYSNI